MNDQSEAERACIEEWTLSAVDAARYAGYVTMPWRPSPGILEQLNGYYVSGLTPDEAAQALFATHH